jgi:hypothetical protein
LNETSLDLIFKYALCFNGYEAFGGLERLGEIANQKLFFFSEHGAWLGSAKELRGCLFFEQRRWMHFGYSPQRDDLNALANLFERIQFLIQQGDLAPNDGPEAEVYGCAPVVIDGVPSRLLEWTRANGLLLKVAIDDSGEVVERVCPPSVVKPDDLRLLEQMPWLFPSDEAPTGEVL